jgi:hypothetical protein
VYTSAEYVDWSTVATLYYRVIVYGENKAASMRFVCQVSVAVLDPWATLLPVIYRKNQAGAEIIATPI